MTEDDRVAEAIRRLRSSLEISERMLRSGVFPRREIEQMLREDKAALAALEGRQAERSRPAE